MKFKKAGEEIDPMFKANRGSTEQTLDIIRSYYKNYNYILDPHTALGVLAAKKIILKYQLYVLLQLILLNLLIQ